MRFASQHKQFDVYAIMEAMVSDSALFELPEGSRKLKRRIVLLTGASGSGKTSLVRRLGIPTVTLDDFYFDHDHPGLPRRFGIVDWDNADTWNRRAAVETLLQVCREGEAEVPIYDIPSSTRTGSRRFVANGSLIVVAEGIFAAEIARELREQQVLADAIAIARPRFATFWFRLLRDLGESRKPPLTLIRRGWALARSEPTQLKKWQTQGCRRLSPAKAEHCIRGLISTPA